MITSQYPIFRQELLRTYSHFWNHDQITEMKFRLKLAACPSFKNCFGSSGNNLTKPFIDDIKRRTKGEIPLSLVIQIRGLQGTGKTKVSFAIAKQINPKFSAKNVFLEREKLLKACSKAKANDVLILDEQTIEFGEGSQRQLAEVQNIQEVTRINQIHFIYNSPTTRNHLAAHYSLEILQQNREFRFTKFAFCSNSYQNYYGFGLVSIPLDSEDSLYLAYEPQKLAYVDKILQRNTQKYDVFSLSEALLAEKLVKFCKTKQDYAVLAKKKWPTLTTGEIKSIISACGITLRKKWHKEALERQKAAPEVA